MEVSASGLLPNSGSEFLEAQKGGKHRHSSRAMLHEKSGESAGNSDLLQGRQGSPRVSLNAAIAECLQSTRPFCFPGQLNKDVTYAHLYSFLNCLQVSTHWLASRPANPPCSSVIKVFSRSQVSPCHGWMSSNKTLRTLTSEVRLSQAF